MDEDQISGGDAGFLNTATWNAQYAPLMCEFWGAFFLVLTITLSAGHPLAAFAIGTVLSLCIYATGPLSGGHLNPAVTLGVLLRGKIPEFNVLTYMTAQILGAMCAALIGIDIKDQTIIPKTGDGYTVGTAFLVECLFSCLLVGTVLFVATSKSSENNDYFGYAIGMVVFVGAVCCGEVSGAAFNPAVTIGLYFGSWVLINDDEYSPDDIWIGIVGPFIGAIVAAVWYRLTAAREFNTRKSGIKPKRANMVMQQEKDRYALLKAEKSLAETESTEGERGIVSTHGGMDKVVQKKLDYIIQMIQAEVGGHQHPGGGHRHHHHHHREAEEEVDESRPLSS